ncbi:AAA family ATPase [Agromyces bauzanensis]|uniref:Pilus biosynthesis protein CpaE n=1 Tax=Agromyces bauzanensis TaxID=1308924 RepID=A0A917UNZ4_9MICO|nr:P-loop NTPase [Agromyces bauzanensis]GGJ70923.1 pilus biosynthesis protein CpaE [Agromyces bauzanensis]
MARLAIALDPSTEDRLLADVVEHGHTIVGRLVGWRDVLESLDVLAPEVVLVGAGRDTLSAELLSGCDERGIRIVALAAGDAERAHATQLGLHEVLDRSTGWSRIEPLVRGGLPVPSRVGDAPPRASRSASVIAVWGPAGAPGRTTVAVNLAAELAAAGHAVALVDADPYGGTIAPLLGLLDEAPGFASACRLAGGGALDRAELERIAQRYSAPRASFDVFTGLVGPSRWPELSAERVTATLEVIRGWVEYVVIDTGFSLERDEELTSDQFAPRRNAATFAAVSSADRVIAVGLADPVGLSRLLRGYGELVDLVEPERIDVMANRVRTSALGIDAHAQVRQTLRRFSGIADVAMLPHDGRATDAAILTARTLRDAAPRSPLRAALREYALERLLPVPEPARRPVFRLAPLRRAADRAAG